MSSVERTSCESSSSTGDARDAAAKARAVSGSIVHCGQSAFQNSGIKERGGSTSVQWFGPLNEYVGSATASLVG